MKTELKIKIASLAAESRIIRSEERRYTLTDQVNKRLTDFQTLLRETRQIASYASNPATVAEAEHRYQELLAQYKKRRTELRAKYAKLRAHPKAVELRSHRVNHVRPQSRHTLLAYGFLRGRSYAEIENKTTTPLSPNRQSDQLDLLPSFDKIYDMLKRFNIGHGYIESTTLSQRFAEWFDAATAHLKSQGWDAAHMNWKGVELGKPVANSPGVKSAA